MGRSSCLIAMTLYPELARRWHTGPFVFAPGDAGGRIKTSTEIGLKNCLPYRCFFRQSRSNPAENPNNGALEPRGAGVCKSDSWGKGGASCATRLEWVTRANPDLAGADVVAEAKGSAFLAFALSALCIDFYWLFFNRHISPMAKAARTSIENAAR
jgi:hypothetical protein